MDDQRVTIETPEHVTLSYEVAGPSSRMVAAFLDHLIIALTIAAVVLLAVSLQVTIAQSMSVAIAIIVGGPLLLVVVYFTIFEVSWSGQTPGKRAAGLRVMRDDGTPVSLLDVLIRNTVRIVDFLPYLYFVGGTVSFFQRHGKRLGDLAAGTVVVKLRETSLTEVGDRPDRAEGAAEALGSVARSAARSLTAAELSSIRRFLDRRSEFDRDVRSRLAREMLSAVADKLPAEAIATGEQNPEAVLEAVARARDEAAERF